MKIEIRHPRWAALLAVGMLMGAGVAGGPPPAGAQAVTVSTRTGDYYKIVDLKVVKSTAGHADVKWASPNEHAVVFGGKKAGDAITFAFSVGRADRYSIETVQVPEARQGRYEVLIDGVTLGPPLDFSDGGGMSRGCGSLSLAAGGHTITYRLLGPGRYQATSAKLYALKLSPA